MKTGIINTCKEILELKDDFTLDMCMFERDIHCGTSYCIAGRLAYLDNYPKKFYDCDYEVFEYLAYSLFKIEHGGCEFSSGSDSPIWTFLFGEEWPSCLEHAKRRAQYLIDNKGQVPEWFCVQGNYALTWRLLRANDRQHF